MASYNGEKFIREQLESILIQLTDNDEVIISDDSSTDSTVQIIKEFNDPRIKLFENQQFRNHIFNFENALKKATGDYIFLSDQDDIWMPNKVAIMKEGLSKANLVLSDCVIILDTNGSKEVIADSFFQYHKSKLGFINNFYKNFFLGCCLAFDKKTLNNILPFPRKINSHDTWIGLIAELTGKTSLIHDKLITFRRHNNNFSVHHQGDVAITKKSPYSLMQIFSSRAYLFFHLLKRYFSVKMKRR